MSSKGASLRSRVFTGYRVRAVEAARNHSVAAQNSCFLQAEILISHMTFRSCPTPACYEQTDRHGQTDRHTVQVG